MSGEQSTRVRFPGASIDIEGVGLCMPRSLPDGLPGAGYAHDLTAPPDGRIAVADSVDPYLSFDREEWSIDLGLPFATSTPDQVLFLAQNLAEGARQRGGMFLLHAAATVSPEGEGHLLVGTQGSGKTATTLALCLEQGHQLVGNDLVLLRADPEGMSLVEGTTHIHIRETAVRANEFLANIAGISPLEGVDPRPSFMRKTRVESEDIGIETAEGPIPLKHVWLVWLDGRKVELPAIMDTNPIANSLFFSERMARHVSGIISPIMGHDGQVLLLPPSFDSPEAQRQRTAAINYLSALCRHLTGPDGSQAAAFLTNHTP